MQRASSESRASLSEPVGRAPSRGGSTLSFGPCFAGALAARSSWMLTTFTRCLTTSFAHSSQSSTGYSAAGA
eukprot:1377931-Lingulodinium_polyedra.AAC.1